MATIPKDAKDLFDSKVPEALKLHPDKAREVNAVYYFDIAGDGGGQWTVDLASNPPKVAQGNAGNAQCSIEVSHGDFMDMLKDPQLGMQLFFQGRLKVTGDPMLAASLQRFFDVAAQS